MKNPRIIPTLPGSPRYVTVFIVGIHLEAGLNDLEIYADVEEQFIPYAVPARTPSYRMEDYDYKRVRKGRVRLTSEAAVELSKASDTLVRVEDSHVEWE